MLKKNIPPFGLALLLLGAGACDLTGEEPLDAPESASPAETSVPEVLTAMVDFGGGPTEIRYTGDPEGMAVFCGDMVLGPADIVRQGRLVFATPEEQDGEDDPNVIFSAISHLNGWPGGRVFYDIDDGAFPGNSVVRTRILAAIAEWNSRTVVRIVPRDPANGFQHFVTFTGPIGTMGAGEGRAALGFQPFAPQLIRLGSNVSQRTIEHEIGHTVGLFHEQSRTDRDNFVRVNTGNIQAGREGNFDTYGISGAVGLDFGPYDISSLMHYGSFTFAANGRIPTLVRSGCSFRSRTAPCTFGGGRDLSTGDVAGVTRLVTGDPFIKFRLRNFIIT